MTAVPATLEAAIQKASATYHIPADLLEGIWQIESGGHYPNPYANGLGYGGEFGTRMVPAFGPASEIRRITEPPVQQQADQSASILAQDIRGAGGDISKGLYAYSGHGYTSVPGEKTFGQLNIPGSTPVYYDPGQSGGLVPRGVKQGVSSVEKGVTGAFDWVKTYVLKGVLIILGSAVALMGLYLIVRALGAPSIPIADKATGFFTRGAVSPSPAPRRAGDAAADRGEPVTRTDAPEAPTRTDKRQAARNERGRQRATERAKRDRDARYGGDDDIPF